MRPPLGDSAARGAFGHNAHLTGRLRPGVTATQAQADLDTLADGNALREPDTRSGLRVTVSEARTLPAEFSQAVVAVVGLLTALVGLVRLVACVNIASLMR